jgi:hypothetical protein
MDEKEVKELELPEAIQEMEEVPGIFITKDTISNMDMERILVQRTRLSRAAQEEAVDKLVDRTPNFLKLKDEVRIEKIKAVLTQETVVEYLRHEGIIRKNVDMVEVGVDEEGSVVVTAFYTKMNREMRRAIQKQFTADQVAKAEQAVNILAGDDNLVDLAAARLKKMSEQGKKLPKRFPRKR